MNKICAGNLRDGFELWAKKKTGFDLSRTEYPMTKGEDQQYKDVQTNTAFFAWISCAEWYGSNDDK